MNSKGFTLVELLIVVAIIGILVAIAVPNLLDAIDKSKQRATVAEMRLWGLALQDYNASQNKMPAPSVLGACPGPTGPPSGTLVSGQTDLALRTTLVPFTINTLAVTDKWGFPFCYETNQVDSYTIRSCGKGGVCAIGAEVTPNTWFYFDLDIVLSDGVFTHQPS